MVPQDGSVPPTREGDRAHCMPLPPSAAAGCGATSYHSANECTSQVTKELLSSGLPGSDVHSSAGADLDDDDAWLPAEGDSSEGAGEDGHECSHEEAAAAAGAPDAAAQDEVEGEEEGSYEADEQEEEEEELVYCTNCTAPLYTSFLCEDCGHSKAQDTTLFSCQQPAATSSLAMVPDPQPQPQQAPLLIWDEHMLLHDEGKVEPHPERPDRLRAIMAQLTRSGLTDACVRVPSRPATEPELLAVHTPDHLRRLVATCTGADPSCRLPSDTYVNQHTLSCALLAAGSAAEAAVQVARGAASCGAAIIRPPGHHAESNTAMGFCFYNNAAVAARAAQAAGAGRVLILDWDVHHGNGTQHIFEDDPTVMYMSLHRYDRGEFYPGTGSVEEVGRGAGAGATVNVPWDGGGVGDGDYLAAFNSVLLPIVRAFDPSLILISAGFDAARGDPIGGCSVSPACYGHLTASLLALAPCVLLLEGGYNLVSTALSTEACLRVLLGQAPAALGPTPTTLVGYQAIRAARQRLASFWPVLADPRVPPPPVPPALRPCGPAWGRPNGHARLGPHHQGWASSGGKALLPPAAHSLAAAAASAPRRIPVCYRRRASSGSGGGGLCGGGVSSSVKRPLQLRLLQGIHKRALRLFWRKRRAALASRGNAQGSH